MREKQLNVHYGYMIRKMTGHGGGGGQVELHSRHRSRESTVQTLVYYAPPSKVFCLVSSLIGLALAY